LLGIPILSGAVAIVSGGMTSGGMFGMLMFLAVAAYISVRQLWLTSYQLVLTPATLCWRAPLRQGRIPLLSLRGVEVGSMRLTRIVAADGSQVSLFARSSGLGEFLDQLHAAAPHVQIRVA
jgi:hypothetical protein